MSSISPYGAGWAYQGTTDSLLSNQNMVGAMLDSNTSSIRFQIAWHGIETAPGVYDWTAVDDLVTTANTYGFNITFPIQNAPDWHLTTLVCDPSRNIAIPEDAATFLTQLLQRYPPGTFASVESANEGYNTPNICTGMFDPQMRDLLAALRPVIDQYSPGTLLGAPADLNAVPSNIAFWIDAFYQSGCQQYVDFLNFHFYPGNHAPDSPASGKEGFTQWWSDFHAASVRYGDDARKIRITEIGWTLDNGKNGGVPDDTLAGYITDFLTSAAGSGCVEQVYYFNLGQLAPGKGSKQHFDKASYNAWKDFIATYPTWE